MAPAKPTTGDDQLIIQNLNRHSRGQAPERWHVGGDIVLRTPVAQNGLTGRADDERLILVALGRVYVGRAVLARYYGHGEMDPFVVEASAGFFPYQIIPQQRLQKVGTIKEQNFGMVE